MALHRASKPSLPHNLFVLVQEGPSASGLKLIGLLANLPFHHLEIIFTMFRFKLMGPALWRLMLTTEAGKERWTAWEVIDTIFPYDLNAYVRTFNNRGVVLVWSSLPSRQLVELLSSRLTRAYKFVTFNDTSPARLRDIIASAKRILKGSRDVDVVSKIRGNHLEIDEEKLSSTIMERLELTGGKKKLVINVVWDVVGLSLVNEN